MIADFCSHYGLTFNDPGLVKLALTHRSYLHVTGQARDSNERLEFLGDSVLGLVTSEYLYRTHPNEHEGQLTKTKSLPGFEGHPVAAGPGDGPRDGSCS